MFIMMLCYPIIKLLVSFVVKSYKVKHTFFFKFIATIFCSANEGGLYEKSFLNSPKPQYCYSINLLLWSKTETAKEYYQTVLVISNPSLAEIE